MPPGLQAFLEDVSAWAALLWVGAALVALGMIGKWISAAWPKWRRLFQIVDVLIELPELMERIRHQVENDHDTNLRDEVTEILELANDTASKLAEVADQQKQHELKSVATLRRIAAIEDHIKEKP